MIHAQQDEPLRKIPPAIDFLLVLGVFGILMPPGFQACVTAVLVLWFFLSGGLKELTASHQKGEQSHWLKKLRMNYPLLHTFLVFLMISIIFRTITFTSELAFPQYPMEIGKTIKDNLRLIGKQGIYGFHLMMIYTIAVKRGWAIRKGLPWLAGLLALLACYMTIQRYTGIDLIHGVNATLPLNRFAYGVYRTGGLISHPLTFSYNCMLFCLLSYGMFRFDSTITEKEKRLWSICFLISMFCLFLSASRWPMLVTIGLIIASEAYRLRGRLIRLIPILAIACAALITENTIIKRVQEIQTDKTNLEQRIPRIVFWQIHWQMFQDHVWTGVGYSARKKARLDYYDRKGFRNFERKYAAHNTYLQTLADSGLIGFTSLLLLIAGIAMMIRHISGQKHMPIFLLILMGSLLGGLLQNNLLDSEFLYALWVALALLIAYCQSRHPDAINN
ncbi:MAG: hypothetical protein CMP10_19700 [Zetaproteobacteria bacterium]|nr:hypothetical protein [Pseudobdellovibrionaceae bacterium]